MTRDKRPLCACRPGCDFRAEPGEPYAIAHDPRPERALLRSKAMSERRQGIRKPRWPATLWEFQDRYTPHEVPIHWRAIAKSVEGVPMDAAELAAFAEVAGHAEPSPTGYEEVLTVLGRGSDKTGFQSRVAVKTCVVDGPAHLAALPPGSQLSYMLIAGSIKQARIALKYAAGLFDRYPELGAELDGEPVIGRDGGSIKLRNGIEITVAAWSKASVRGPRLIGVGLDECAWTPTGEQSAHQDVEVVAALRGGMIAPDGAPPRRLISTTSAGGRRGYVYETHEEYFGKPHPSVLVVRAASRTMNPSISEKQLARAQERDPLRYEREYGYTFSDTVSKWVDAYIVDAAADGRTGAPLPPLDGVHYAAAIDAGFKRDAFSLAIAHSEQTPSGAPRLVVDAIERIVPAKGVPLDSVATVARCAGILKAYGVREIWGDQFSSIPLAGEFRRHGIELVEETATSRSKLEHYSRLREMFYARRVSLPRHDVTLREFRDLQETITAGGTVRIDHPVGGSSDCASAVTWAAAALEMHQPASTAAYWMQVYGIETHPVSEAEEITDFNRETMARLADTPCGCRRQPNGLPAITCARHAL